MKLPAISKKILMRAAAGTAALGVAIASSASGQKASVIVPVSQKAAVAKQLPLTKAEICNTRRAVYAMDADTGIVLLDECGAAPRWPASMTKVNVLYLTFQALRAGKLTLDTMLPVSDHARWQERFIGLKHNDSISVRDCILDITVYSGNDCPVVLAEKLAGSEKDFVVKMNALADALGMHHTSYANASGLPDRKHHNEQLSTAHDTAILLQSIMRDFPEYAYLFQAKEFTFRHRVYQRHDDVMYGNSDLGITAIKNLDVDKTGYTDDSGANICAHVARQNRRIIFVVMGADSRRERGTLLAQTVDNVFSKPAPPPPPPRYLTLAL